MVADLVTYLSSEHGQVWDVKHPLAGLDQYTSDVPWVEMAKSP